jgi:hypothetical protein
VRGTNPDPPPKLLTLYFNTNNSFTGPSHWCGWCGRNADPFELRHETIPSRVVKYGGCGVRWLYITSEMGADGERRARSVRPDLIWLYPGEIDDDH